MSARRTSYPVKRYPSVSQVELDSIAEQPVLDVGSFSSPITIASVELLQAGSHTIVRTRATDGAEGYAVTTKTIELLHPIFTKRVAPVFVGQDARRLEALLEKAYVQYSNYKMQSPALWSCVAWVEFSILDLLGNIAGKPVGELIGGILRRNVPVYLASYRRDTTPEEEVDLLQKGIEETSAKAVKFRLGGRMSRNADAMPGRTENLIRLAAERLPQDVALHADANGSYDATKAIEVGRLLEDVGAYYFEEPCRFDHLEETKIVADTLKIPVSGGEQESSMWRFRWMIQHAGVNIIQPDVVYTGGLIRSMRVARMAERMGMPTTPHITGQQGVLYNLHFVACVPDIGGYQEFQPLHGVKDFFDPPLEPRDGRLALPDGPGFGMVHLPEIAKDATPYG